MKKIFCKSIVCLCVLVLFENTLKGDNLSEPAIDDKILQAVIEGLQNNNMVSMCWDPSGIKVINYDENLKPEEKIYHSQN